MKFDIEVFRDTDVRFQFWLKSGKNMNTLHPSQVFCAKYVLEGKIFWIEIVEKNETHSISSTIFL